MQFWGILDKTLSLESCRKEAKDALVNDPGVPVNLKSVARVLDDRRLGVDLGLELHLPASLLHLACEKNLLERFPVARVCVPRVHTLTF